MTTDSSGTGKIDEIIGEYLDRKQAGEQPTTDEYVQRFPEYADEILSLIKTVEMADADFAAEDDFADACTALDNESLTQLAGYRIVRELGRGGMGIVYEAEHEGLGRRAALKVLLSQASRDSQSVRRFLREGKAVAKMHHSNIVPLYEVGEEDGRFFLAMQLIDGPSLDQVIRILATDRTEARGESEHSETIVGSFFTGTAEISNASAIGASSSTNSSHARQLGYFRRVAGIGVQAAEALAYAHRRGFVHRDIKPSNLLLDENGVAWLTDFGLAKSEDDNLTHTGDFVGTLRYMAPERFKGQCDERSDIYALGLTLYEFLALRPAFDSSDRLNMIRQISNDEPKRLRTMNRSIPRDLETIVMKAIDKDPRARYPSSSAFAADLKNFIHDLPLQARRHSVIEQFYRWSRRNRGLAASLIVAAASMLCVVVGAVFFLLRESELRQAAETGRADAQRSQYFSEMNLAAQSIDRAGGKQLLRSTIQRWEEKAPHLLGWEWQYMQRAGQTDSVPFANQKWSAAVDADWSPDNSQVVVVYEGTPEEQCKELYVPEIWNAETGVLIHRLQGCRSASTAVAWHPKRPLIAGTADDGFVRFWDSKTGTLVQELDFRPGEPKQVSWSKDGTRLAVSVVYSYHSSIAVLDSVAFPLPEDAVKSSLNGCRRVGDFIANRDLKWSFDETQISVRAQSGEYGQTQRTVIWDINKRGPKGPAFEAASVRWLPTDNALGAYVTCRPSGVIQVWDAQTHTETGRLIGHTAQIESVAFSPDGNTLISASYDKTVRVWDLESRRIIRNFQEHHFPIRMVRWNRTGTKVLSAGWDNSTRLWDIKEPRRTMIRIPRNDGGIHPEVIDLCWQPNGRSIVAVGPGFAQVWDTESGKSIAALNVPKEKWFGCCEWDSSGNTLAVGGAGIRLFRMDSSGNMPEIKFWRGWGHDLAFHPTDERLIVSSGRKVRFIETTKQRTETSSNDEATDTGDGWTQSDPLESADEPFFSVAWNPKTPDLVAYANGLTILVRNLATDSLFELHGHSDRVENLDWHPNGGILASSSFDSEIILWDVAKREATQTLRGHSNVVSQVNWSPNGERIATAGKDGSVKVWDAETGFEIMSLSDLTSAVNCVKWSPTGARLAAGDLSGTIVIWNAMPHESQSRAE